jgi:RNA polymerase sigma factor (TIGR02999 family)
MPDRESVDVTQLLARWVGGDREALESVAAIVDAELRRIADAYLRREREGHTLQPTALVNEAWLRLMKPATLNFEGRKHFFALAAQIMRRILVDHARMQKSDKRGAGVRDVTFDEQKLAASVSLSDFLLLDDALTGLAKTHSRKAKIIELRYFAGLTLEEVAELMGLSVAAVNREQHLAEALLNEAMSAPPTD